MFEFLNLDIVRIVFAILSIVVTSLIVYVSFFWKAKVYILENLGKDEKVYTTVKTIYVYSNKDVVYWNNRGYFLVNPTFTVGTKKHYIFEKDNSTPLVLNEKSPIDALKVKHIIRDNVIAQLIKASYTPPLKIRDIIIIAVIVVIAIILIYAFLPNMLPTVHTTPTPTVTPVPTVRP